VVGGHVAPPIQRAQVRQAPRVGRIGGVKPEGTAFLDNNFALPAALDGLGQALFAPPNVKGWVGGLAWLNTATVLARHNLAWRFLEGEPRPLGARVDVAGLVREYAGDADPAGQVEFLLALFLQAERKDVPAPVRRKLIDFVTSDSPDGRPTGQQLRETAHAVLLLPEYQLA
jgi:hypothetical protein